MRSRFVALVLSFFVLCGLSTSAPALADTGVRVDLQRIPVAQGVELTAGVYRAAGPGPHPLIVIPPGYGMPNLPNLIPALKLAGAGYDVITYTPRGQWTSSGDNNLLSPTDVADVSRIIDWAGAQLGSDTTRVGATGISQGSVLSLLAAANDPRIRAVSSMSTSGDVLGALLPNNTWVDQFMQVVKLSPLFTRPGPEAQFVLDHFDRNDRTGLADWGAVRSASTRLADLNAHQPAVMISNTWQDNIFQPIGVVSFFDQLETPKRLLLSPGDHATAEAGGLAGAPNEVWDSTYRWFDHYLRGAANGVDTEKPVRLYPSLNGPAKEFDSWQASIAGADRRYLGGLTPLVQRTGELAATPLAGWNHTITGGVNTVAENAPIELGGVGAPLGVAVPGLIPLVNRLHAGVWQTQVQSGPRLLSGTPRVHVTLTPTAPAATVVAYLYDVDVLGVGKLLTHAPYSITGATPGTPRAVDIPIQPLRHTVQKGHRMVLVVDTVDQRYRSETAVGQQITLSSPSGDPSFVDLPW